MSEEENPSSCPKEFAVDATDAIAAAVIIDKRLFFFIILKVLVVNIYYKYIYNKIICLG
jgi:hypothetical protein